MIAKRLENLDVSGIRKVFDLASKMKNPINLSIGQPDFDVPKPIKDESIRSIINGKNGYTPSQGIPALREGVSQLLEEKGLAQKEVLITSGVSGGIMLSLMALLDPGDEVIIPDPYFVMYRHLPELIGAKVRYVDLYPDFKMTAEKIEKVLSPKTKAIFINQPSNPTGMISDWEEMKQISNLLQSKGIWAISDDIYSDFDYENKHDYFGKLYEKTITLGGFSKNLGMTGWRVGYAHGDFEVIDAMIRIQQYTFVCSPSMAQWGAIKGINQDFRDVCTEYKKRRDLVVQALEDKFILQQPDGAFYCFIQHPEMNGDDFVDKALEKEILLIPGSVFSRKNTHFRLSFASSIKNLEKGIERLLEI